MSEEEVRLDYAESWHQCHRCGYITDDPNKAVDHWNATGHVVYAVDVDELIPVANFRST